MWNYSSIKISVMLLSQPSFVFYVAYLVQVSPVPVFSIHHIPSWRVGGLDWWAMRGWAGPVRALQPCSELLRHQTKEVNKTMKVVKVPIKKKKKLEQGVTFCARSSLSRAILSLTLCLVGRKTIRNSEQDSQDFHKMTKFRQSWLFPLCLVKQA